MEKEAAAGDNPEPLKYKTWALKVSIHCGGCKKKVKKVLQSVEGVYKIEIDSKQHKVVVSGNVEAETLTKKLIKSGKHAKLWPENPKPKKKEKQKESDDDGDGSGSDTEQAENPTKDNNNNGNGKENQKRQPQKEANPTSGDDLREEKGGGPAQTSGGGGKKKKKKKKKGNSGLENGGGGGGAPPPGNGESAPASMNAGPPSDQMNLNPPLHPQILSYPPHFYYPAPEYGMSYNTAPPTPSMTTSYYTSPLNAYSHSHPYYYPPSLQSDWIGDFNRSDDHYSAADDESGCSIM